MYTCLWRVYGPERRRGRPVNVLNLTRALALDAVDGGSVGKRYCEMDEQKTTEQFSASLFVDIFVAVGRFFLLPNYVFVFLEMMTGKLYADEHVYKSMAVRDGCCQWPHEKCRYD